MKMLAYVAPACLAGVFAALAALVGKMAMAGRETFHMCENVEDYLRQKEIVDSLECRTITAYIRLTCFLAIILCNTIMWTFFSKSLQRSQNSVEPVVVNTATNVFLSAIFGFIIYKEAISLTWCMGAALILIGLFILISGDMRVRESEEIKEDIKLD